ncbi:MAG TPA: TonB-dependent receptor plug domain-containing protein [Opitutus sp.]|nr:TonB-dependent receptor plug domain-containing protein [Opitutus sp.]
MHATAPRTKILCLAAAGLSLLTNSGLAQAAAPAAEDTATNDDQVVVLSPFVVDSSKDEGYRATATLAGSRINTPLRDVAQSITVVTKEFLTDIDAVNVNDVLAFTANTEGTRDFNSFSLSLGAPQDNAASNSNSANRVRGLSSADFTRDYFYTIGTYNGFDAYNLDEVTINRGPNSVLAGLGSPAGIINFSPQLANLANNRNEVSFRFGSWGDTRETLNINYVVKKNVFAVRLAAENSDKGFKQQPAYNRDRRAYFAAAWHPLAKTTLRGSFELQHVTANNPNTLTPQDGLSEWIVAGRPIWNPNSGQPVSPLLTVDGTNAPVLTYNQSGALERSYNESYQGDGPSYFFYESVPSGGVAHRMNNNRYFNLSSVNLNPSLDQARNYRAFNFSLDQEIIPDLNFNAAIVHEVVNADYLNLFRSGYATYSVDVNALLPDGSANPHVGETFMQFGGLDNKNSDHNTNTVWRATLTYQLDLNKYSKWLGRYNLTGFYEERRTETNHLQYNAKDVAHPTIESINYRYYLGGTSANDYQAQTVPGNPGIVTNVSPNLYFDSDSGTFKTNSLDVFYGLKSNSKFLRNLSTSAFVAQGYLWGDRIVPMFGVRQDKDETQNASAQNNPATPGVVDPAGAYGPVNQFTKTTRTYGVVVHALKWLSFHYNRSENFIPNAGSIDLLGNPVGSPTGLTKEYGFSVDTPDGKLNAKVNWFELTAAGANADNLTFPLAQWTVPYMELTFMPDLVRQANANGANITYQPLLAPGITTGDPRLAGAYTSSNVSKGVELELTYNVTKNWRLMANISKQDAKQSDIAKPLTDFIENRLAYWKSIPAIWSGPYVGQDVGWGVGRTGEQQWNNDNNPYYLLYKSVDGQPSQQLAKWHASLVTNYEFTDGPLHGFNLGGGVRYIEKQIIGNPQILDGSGTPIALDLEHPYYNGDRLAVDMWAGYKMAILNDRYRLRFQLNIRDLDQGGGFRPILANPDGTHSTYQIVQPRSFYLTTALEF